MVLTAVQLTCAGHCLDGVIPGFSPSLLAHYEANNGLWRQRRDTDTIATSERESLLQLCLDEHLGPAAAIVPPSGTAAAPLVGANATAITSSNLYPAHSSSASSTSSSSQATWRDVSKVWTCCQMWQDYLGCRSRYCGIQSDSFHNLYAQNCFDNRGWQTAAAHRSPSTNLIPNFFLKGSLVIEFRKFEERNAFWLLSRTSATVNQNLASYLRERLWQDGEFRRLAAVGNRTQGTRSPPIGYEELDIWVSVEVPSGKMGDTTAATGSTGTSTASSNSTPAGLTGSIVPIAAAIPTASTFLSASALANAGFSTQNLHGAPDSVLEQRVALSLSTATLSLSATDFGQSQVGEKVRQATNTNATGASGAGSSLKKSGRSDRQLTVSYKIGPLKYADIAASLTPGLSATDISESSGILIFAAVQRVLAKHSQLHTKELLNRRGKAKLACLNGSNVTEELGGYSSGNGAPTTAYEAVEEVFAASSKSGESASTSKSGAKTSARKLVGSSISKEQTETRTTRTKTAYEATGSLVGDHENEDDKDNTLLPKLLEKPSTGKAIKVEAEEQLAAPKAEPSAPEPSAAKRSLTVTKYADLFVVENGPQSGRTTSALCPSGYIGVSVGCEIYASPLSPGSKPGFSTAMAVQNGVKCEGSSSGQSGETMRAWAFCMRETSDLTIEYDFGANEVSCANGNKQILAGGCTHGSLTMGVSMAKGGQQFSSSTPMFSQSGTGDPGWKCGGTSTGRSVIAVCNAHQPNNLPLTYHEHEDSSNANNTVFCPVGTRVLSGGCYDRGSAPAPPQNTLAFSKPILNELSLLENARLARVEGLLPSPDGTGAVHGRLAVDPNVLAAAKARGEPWAVNDNEYVVPYTGGVITDFYPHQANLPYDQQQEGWMCGDLEDGSNYIAMAICMSTTTSTTTVMLFPVVERISNSGTSSGVMAMCPAGDMLILGGGCEAVGGSLHTSSPVSSTGNTGVGGRWQCSASGHSQLHATAYCLNRTAPIPRLHGHMNWTSETGLTVMSSEPELRKTTMVQNHGTDDLNTMSFTFETSGTPALGTSSTCQDSGAKLYGGGCVDPFGAAIMSKNAYVHSSPHAWRCLHSSTSQVTHICQSDTAITNKWELPIALVEGALASTPVRAICPAGYVVIGGGCDDYAATGMPEHTAMRPLFEGAGGLGTAQVVDLTQMGSSAYTVNLEGFECKDQSQNKVVKPQALCMYTTTSTTTTITTSTTTTTSSTTTTTTLVSVATVATGGVGSGTTSSSSSVANFLGVWYGDDAVAGAYQSSVAASATSTTAFGYYPGPPGCRPCADNEAVASFHPVISAACPTQAGAWRLRAAGVSATPHSDALFRLCACVKDQGLCSGATAPDKAVAGRTFCPVTCAGAGGGVETCQSVVNAGGVDAVPSENYLRQMGVPRAFLDGGSSGASSRVRRWLSSRSALETEVARVLADEFEITVTGIETAAITAILSTTLMLESLAKATVRQAMSDVGVLQLLDGIYSASETYHAEMVLGTYEGLPPPSASTDFYDNKPAEQVSPSASSLHYVVQYDLAGCRPLAVEDALPFTTAHVARTANAMLSGGSSSWSPFLGTKSISESQTAFSLLHAADGLVTSSAAAASSTSTTSQISLLSKPPLAYALDVQNAVFFSCIRRSAHHTNVLPGTACTAACALGRQPSASDTPNTFQCPDASAVGATSSQTRNLAFSGSGCPDGRACPDLVLTGTSSALEPILSWNHTEMLGTSSVAGTSSSSASASSTNSGFDATSKPIDMVRYRLAATSTSSSTSSSSSGSATGPVIMARDVDTFDGTYRQTATNAAATSSGANGTTPLASYGEAAPDFYLGARLLGCRAEQYQPLNVFAQVFCFNGRWTESAIDVPCVPTPACAGVSSPGGASCGASSSGAVCAASCPSDGAFLKTYAAETTAIVESVTSASSPSASPSPTISNLGGLALIPGAAASDNSITAANRVCVNGTLLPAHVITDWKRKRFPPAQFASSTNSLSRDDAWAVLNGTISMWDLQSEVVFATFANQLPLCLSAPDAVADIVQVVTTKTQLRLAASSIAQLEAAAPRIPDVQLSTCPAAPSAAETFLTSRLIAGATTVAAALADPTSLSTAKNLFNRAANLCASLKSALPALRESDQVRVGAVAVGGSGTAARFTVAVASAYAEDTTASSTSGSSSSSRQLRGLTAMGLSEEEELEMDSSIYMENDANQAVSGAVFSALNASSGSPQLASLQAAFTTGFAEAFAGLSPGPTVTGSTATPPSAQLVEVPRYSYTAWSECSNTCGEGEQTRSADCVIGASTPVGLNCGSLTREPLSMACTSWVQCPFDIFCPLTPEHLDCWPAQGCTVLAIMFVIIFLISWYFYNGCKVPKHGRVRISELKRSITYDIEQDEMTGKQRVTWSARMSKSFYAKLGLDEDGLVGKEPQGKGETDQPDLDSGADKSSTTSSFLRQILSAKKAAGFLRRKKKHQKEIFEVAKELVCFGVQKPVDYWSATQQVYVPATIGSAPVTVKHVHVNKEPTENSQDVHVTTSYTHTVDLVLANGKKRERIALDQITVPIKAGEIADFYSAEEDRWLGPVTVVTRRPRGRGYVVRLEEVQHPIVDLDAIFEESDVPEEHEDDEVAVAGGDKKEGDEQKAVAIEDVALAVALKVKEDQDAVAKSKSPVDDEDLSEGSLPDMSPTVLKPQARRSLAMKIKSAAASERLPALPMAPGESRVAPALPLPKKELITEVLKENRTGGQTYVVPRSEWIRRRLEKGDSVVFVSSKCAAAQCGVVVETDHSKAHHGAKAESKRDHARRMEKLLSSLKDAVAVENMTERTRRENAEKRRRQAQQGKQAPSNQPEIEQDAAAVRDKATETGAKWRKKLNLMAALLPDKTKISKASARADLEVAGDGGENVDAPAAEADDDLELPPAHCSYTLTLALKPLEPEAVEAETDANGGQPKAANNDEEITTGALDIVLPIAFTKRLSTANTPEAKAVSL